MARSNRKRAGGIVLAVVLIGGACSGGGGDASPSPSTADETVETTSAASSPSTGEPAVVGSTAGDTTAPAGTSEPQPGGELIVGVESETDDAWTPAKLVCAVSCQTVLRSVLEPLAARDLDGNVVPFLAASITPSDDFTSWELVIREGITFHDGTDLDAGVVVDNLTRQATSLLNGLRLQDVARTADGAPAISATDERTVLIEMSRPWIDFPTYLVNSIGLIGSSQWLAAADTDAAVEAQPVGTGPFVFESYEPGGSFKASRNPNYWRTDAAGTPLPYLDSVEFRPIEDGLSRANALRSGDVDIVMFDDGESILKFREDDDFTMVEESSFGETFYLLLHSGEEGSPLSDKRVRCALVAATDAVAISEIINQSVTSVANGPFSPGQPGYLEESGNGGYDPDLAAELIADYAAENGTPKIVFTTFEDPATLLQAQLLQAWWGEVGIDFEIRQVDVVTMIDEAVFGSTDFDVISWRNHSGYTLDEQYLYWHSKMASPDGAPGVNFGRMRDPVIDELLDANREETDPAVKATYAEDVNRRIAEECWMVPTQWTVWGIAAESNVNGVDADLVPGTDTPLAISQATPGVINVATLWVEG
jgi:peptide/nickel transport system substrate-binding protein